MSITVCINYLLNLKSKVPHCSSYFSTLGNDGKLSISVYGTYDKDDNPVWGYNHSDQLFTNNNKVITPKLELYNSITDCEKISFITIIFDKYNQCYWWLLDVKYFDENSEQLNFNYSNNYLVQLSEKFEVISEGFIPLGCYSAIPTKSGLLVYNAKISDSLGKSYYSIMKPKVQKNSKALIKNELLEKRKSFSINNDLFVKMIFANSKKTKNLMISLDRMPPGYAKILMDKLIANQTILKSISVHIFSHNNENIPEELRDKVHIYRYGELTRYISLFTWPTILDISDQSILTSTKIEYPSNKANELIKIIEGK